MFSRLGRTIAHRPILTVLVWVLMATTGTALAMLGLHGEGLFDRVVTGAPKVPGSESAQGEEILADLNESGSAGGSFTLVVTGVDTSDPQLATTMARVNADLAAVPDAQPPADPFAFPDGVADPRAQSMLADDGTGFLLSIDLEPNLDPDREAAAQTAVEQRLGQVTTDLHQVDSAAHAQGIVSSYGLMVEAVTDQVKEDLAIGEMISMPVALIVMTVVFGGFLAAGMPMVGAIASICSGLGTLLAISYVIPVDASVVNVVTVLGLGLSIDYGLLIVSRFREELRTVRVVDGAPKAPVERRGPVIEEAVVRTMATAGRTVTFSALTVAISISGLVVFEPEILRSIGAGALAIVLIAVATAITLVPAVLVLTGHRLTRPSVVAKVPGLRRILAHTADVQSDDGALSRLAGRVQRHPVFVTVATLAVLGVLAFPVFGLQMRNSGVELLPAGNDQREVVDIIAADYPAISSPQVTVVAKTDTAGARDLATELAAIPNVDRVDPPAVKAGYATVGVHAATDDAGGAVAVGVVHDARTLDLPYPTWVTGQAAGQVDFLESLSERIWWAIAIVIVAVFGLLFLMTGSVVIPLKALVTNVLSLGAALGVLVWVFQDGHLEGVLAFESIGGIETYVVAMVVAFAFGLAMDYEVFLLARVKELHDSGMSTDEAIRIGLQRSGRIITSAAAIIVVVFAGFVFGKLLVIKEVGFALAVAVTIDATVVRLLLVPATMTLLGKYNWWAPAPLRTLYGKLAITH